MIPVYKSGDVFLLRNDGGEQIPYVVISDPQGKEKEVYIVGLQPLPPDSKEEQTCRFEPDSISCLDCTSVLGRVFSLSYKAVKDLQNKKARIEYQNKVIEILKQPVEEDVMAQIYQCLKNSDKVSQKVLNVLIEQGKIKAE